MRPKLSLFFLIGCLSFFASAGQPLPKVSAGKIIRMEHFKSAYAGERIIDIWLPDGYSDTVKYAVLYMHDGQMLFDSATTWNKQSWNMAATATQLMLSGKVRPFIVVGIWNSGVNRHPDYFPQLPYELFLNRTEQDTVSAQLKMTGRSNGRFKPQSDNYLRFLATELKPFIDTTYSVLPQREHTFIAGSSMGGLISLYAVCEYPEVFGGAACLSTHWPGSFTVHNNPFPLAMMLYMQQRLPDAKTHKLYFDYGDQTLDALYPTLQTNADSIMKISGYDSNNWITKYFPGDDHSERSWSKRLAIPLEFLLSTKK
ncbi:MAG: alpha/beta hydrolase [Bacteroidota bacterium]